MKKPANSLYLATEEIDLVNSLVPPCKTSVYPRFRVAPPCGWMGPPSAPVWFRGKYHVYYPLNPFSVGLNTLMLGHSTSEDLLRWEWCQPVMAPDETGPDAGGIISACAVVHEDRLFLFYTGHTETCSEQDKPSFGAIDHALPGTGRRIAQTICYATSKDGITFEKHGAAIPPTAEISLFNSPNVWFDGESWCMTVTTGSALVDEEGKPGHAPSVWLYRSYSLTRWIQARLLITGKPEDGTHWDGAHVYQQAERTFIMYNARGVKSPTGMATQSVWSSGYVMGTGGLEGAFMQQEDFNLSDKGTDFLYSNSVEIADGRRILTGWASMWGDAHPTAPYGFAGMGCFPRELHFKNGRVCQMPLRELRNLRDHHTSLSNQYIDDERAVVSEDAPAFEFKFTINMAKCTADTFGFNIGEGFKMEFEAVHEGRAKKHVGWDVQIRRSYEEQGLSDTRLFRVPLKASVDFHGFFDASITEIFVDDYKEVCTVRIAPELGDRTLGFYALNGYMLVDQIDHWTIR